MKRSNRLVLLIGIFLAIVAFVLIAIMLSGGGGGGGVRPSDPPTTAAIVVASQDIDLGATIQSTDVTLRDVPIDERPADSFSDTSFVVGEIARVKVTAGQYISAAVLNASGGIENIDVPAGLVGIAVQVDQVSGVGTIIKPGDFVDVISGFTGIENVPAGRSRPAAGTPLEYIKVDDTYYNHATVKALAQGLQVLGTLLPPPPRRRPARRSRRRPMARRPSPASSRSSSWPLRPRRPSSSSSPR